MYEIGSKVVYPIHGVGHIQNIEEKDILGKKRKYYVMELYQNNMKVMIPIDMTTKVGLRDIVGDLEIDDAFIILRSKANDLEDDWKIRYSTNQDKLKSGSFSELAIVVRNLFMRNQIKELSNSEKRLFENALKLLITEISYARNLQKVEVEHMITETLEKGLVVNNMLGKEGIEVKSAAI